MLMAPSPVLQLTLPVLSLKRPVPAVPFGEVRPVTPIFVAVPPVIVAVRAVVEPELDALRRSRRRHERQASERRDQRECDEYASEHMRGLLSRCRIRGQ
jgi:hypothetical protein